VIIWTRYTPVSADEKVVLELRMAEVDPELEFDAHLDPQVNLKLHRVLVETTSDSDFVAKIDVVGLMSGKDFVFAFSDGTQVSPIGQTKTAPSADDEVESMTYAVFSCSHFSNGYFHAYDVASTIEDLDFWVHVGDYVVSSGTY
jgi:alkaline phosphatase D